MIEARWATYIADDLRRAGHALDGLLREVGISRAEIASPDGRISYAAFMRLIERAALLLAEPAYGLKLGVSHDVRDNGLLGFIAANSPTLGDALANVERYIAVTNEGTDAALEEAGPVSALRFRDANPTLRTLRQNSERVSALFVKGARELTRSKATPVRVEFIHSRPNERIDYEGILGCSVRFQAEWDAVIFSEETLRLPVIGADNRLLRTLEAACRRIIGPRPRKEDLAHSVRQYVVERLAKGAPAFDDVARHFNMSAKTLERRLGERNAGYRELVDGARCDLAKYYLANTNLRLNQIAYTLGYTEPGPLVRAFRRWTDETPMQYRHKHR
ncbi:AraC family transcriptional regulator [Reyranella soli]|uniref:AraC family transcriptional regulator n=1 Tax=Reyranella soli TaxID=1230389 RepID=A0A512NSZ3_9HYPH|nr:AraC family transcriptional regulator [Reyranella soli]GEP62078.1 AraC family transcriptional regulator [Reyranella soli]